MKNKRPIIKSPLFKAAALVICAAALIAALAACGESAGSKEYSYELRGGELFITAYNEPDSAAGQPYSVPSKIDGKKVYGVASGAYKNCAFTSLTVPNGVEVLEEGAFSGCNDMTAVSIPSSVTELEGAFKLCTSITDMKIEGDRYTLEDGAVYSKDGKTLVMAISGAVTPNGAYSVRAGVEKISAHAFNRAEMSSLTLPDGLVEIGEQAFYSCKQLGSLEIDCKGLTIGTFAFGYCSSLTSVTIKNAYYIGEDAFRRCNELKTVQVENVDYLGNGSFRMCPALTTAYISGSYNYVPADLFSGCSALDDCILEGDFGSDRVNMVDGNEINTINNSAFSGCSSLPAPIIPDGIVNVGPYAFNQCSFVNIYIPYGVKTVAEMAFYECESAKKITLPSTLETIGFQAFAYCENITSVTVPKSVKLLGIMSFYSCYKLEDVNLEEGGCETMGVLCFGNCISINVFRLPQSFREVQITDGVYFTTDIKDSLTYDFTVQSDGKKYATYEVNKYSYGYQFVNENEIQYVVIDNTADIFETREVEGGVELIGVKNGYADYISGHTTLEIPDEINGKPVVSIAYGALSKSGTVSKFISVEKITLPKGLKKIEDGALSDLISLRRVVFTGNDPDGISMTPAVSGNLTLVTFCVPAQSFEGYRARFASIFGDKPKVEIDPDSMFTFAEYEKGYRLVSTIDGLDLSAMQSLTVPDKYNGKPVLAVSQNAFSKAVSATDIYIPASVTRIFDGAFSGCTALQNVHLEVDAGKTVVGSGLLSGTSGVKICVPAEYAPNYLASYEWQEYTIKSE